MASTTKEDEQWLIRSFTPYKEEPFCGHGLVAAAILLMGRDMHCQGKRMLFRTSGGLEIGAFEVPSPRLGIKEQFQQGKPCTVKLEMPAEPVTEWYHEDEQLLKNLAKCLGTYASMILGLGRNLLLDLVVELDPSVDFSAGNMNIDAVGLMNACPSGTRSQIITSRGDSYGVDFLKRVFAYGSEDQATGSTYSLLIPYWSSKLDKSSMKVMQVSERTGTATVENNATVRGYVSVTASGVKVMDGRILVPAP